MATTDYRHSSSVLHFYICNKLKRRDTNLTEEKSRGKKEEKEKKVSNSRTQPLKTGEKEHNILIWDCTPHTDLTKKNRKKKQRIRRSRTQPLKTVCYTLAFGKNR